ncbi:MAG: sulfur oxidation c-type cytochrome SoxX [Henriciella sp.]|uniref:sulfur oxidation c-type cytochrome SoxX n=1 Tax=Henriciella sp. TaxID=1968823 RepID=UPI0032EF6085
MRACLAALAGGLLLTGGCTEAETEQRLAEPATVEGDAIPAPLGGETGDAARGRVVFVNREQGHCVLCHQVDGLDAEFQGNVGPTLTGLGDRLTPAQIRLRVADAQRIWPDTVMPSYYRVYGLNQVGEEYRGEPALTARQIEDLVAWLAALKMEGNEDG